MKRRRWMANTLWMLPALLAGGLYLWLPSHPAVAEWVCARGLFRVVNMTLVALVGWLPFSLTEWSVVFAVPAVMAGIAWLCVCLRRTERRARLLARLARGTAWVLSCTALLYMLTHGCNFYRYTTAELMGMDTSPATAEELQAVVLDLAQKVSAAREDITEDVAGRMVLTQPVTLTLAQADEGYRVLSETYPFLWSAAYRVKPVQLSYWWSYTGIAGMYFPLYGESNVNVDQPPCDIPSTAAHEIAHSCGFAREDECNFYAYLSCIHHPSAEYRYSGYLSAYVHCANALYDYDIDLWRDTQEYVSDGVRRDLAQRRDYWAQFEGETKEVATSVNNQFITSQGDADGVLSYNRVVELIIGYYRLQEALM